MKQSFKNIGFAFLGMLIFVLFSNVLYGQLYISGNLQYSFYSHEKPLELVDVNPNLSFGMGVKIYANQESKFEIAGELNSFRRNFYQKYAEGEYKYLFQGMDVRLLTNYSISESWSLEAGVIFAPYSPKVSKGEENVVLGEGFKEADFGSFIGCHYALSKSMILGARFDFWFINMLEYQEVADYGNLRPVVKDIRAKTAEVFIRFQFLNKWK